jgi:hypothetical protein
MKKKIRSEKINLLVEIGVPQDEFKTTLSLRRSNKEILKRVISR